MVELLRKIYHKLSNYRIIQWACHVYMNGFPLGDFMAFLRLINLKRQKKSDGKIKVAFLCQAIESWNKIQSVFELMISDDRFEPFIIAIPDEIEQINGEVYKYFYKLYGKYVYDSREENGWLNLEQLNPEYVFYQRPYDQYLPNEYRSNIVSRYAKVWHVVYGYQLVTTTQHSVLNKRFFRNVYMYFAENKIYYELNINKFKISHKIGVRKTVNVGYPALEKFMKNRIEKTTDGFNVLWTPRWTEDKELGGSNFINFKDRVLELPKENEDIVLTFRPHPMTFEHFISVGRITKIEVDKYLENFKNERMIYDNGASYEKTFWNSDVLLTDISSIIMEYFLTGKPIVYCDTGATPNKLFEEMLKVIYVVKTWDEAKTRVIELKNGIDPLKEERIKKMSELMGNDFEHISERFLDEMYKDHIA